MPSGSSGPLNPPKPACTPFNPSRSRWFPNPRSRGEFHLHYLGILDFVQYNWFFFCACMSLYPFFYLSTFQINNLNFCVCMKDHDHATVGITLCPQVVFFAISLFLPICLPSTAVPLTFSQASIFLRVSILRSGTLKFIYCADIGNK